ncbi:MAG: hypothetical protein DI586_02280 [Micavibrio aeruginosavorus]|uniref:Uncharacterized protein n=1 Tax=Micavibrio aeruginosavorus TaxID=349221 RepID=A0A2W5HMJ0_9BACT|nr:MAG: hypothetical protein DI586_02280 [Micavibrio aeruginosavorus]
MTRAIPQKSLTISFLQVHQLDNTSPLSGAYLDIPLISNDQPDRIRFHVSCDAYIVHDLLRQGENFKSVNVSEIVTEKGYSYANENYGLLDVVDPFYDVYKTDIPGIYQTIEDTVSITLALTDAVHSKRATLIHQWPDQKTVTRTFEQCGNAYDANHEAFKHFHFGI